MDLDSEEGRAFLQERLAFFGVVGFLVQAGFFVLARLALYSTAPEVVAGDWSLARIGLLGFDLSGQLLFLGLWLYARSGRRPLPILLGLDVLGPFVPCTLSTLPVYQWASGATAVFASLLIVVSALMARAVIVPSNPRRTMRIGVLCSLPLAFAATGFTIPVPALGNPSSRVPLLVPVVLWSACAIALSTLASAVIFGLRRRVSEARSLGQYTLERKIGEGGMGVVYRAQHALLRRPTAVKLLPPERSGSRALERFEREVQTTALLSHPNTIAVYDFGRTPDGIFYYAMEYLEGIDLEELVRTFGPQDPDRVVHVMRQVAGALSEAHSVGLIHRDIKPANVILCERGGIPDVAKVLDFGLVRDLGTVGLSVSAADLVTGTPLFLSPESITAPDRVDARSDIYALGAVAYLLLAGHHPFEGATVVEVCSHHLHTRPQPPSAKLGAPVPAAVEELVLSCLEKDPAGRPQSAAGLERRLAELCERSCWTEERARGWWRENAEAIASLRGTGGAPSSPLPTLAVSLERRLGSHRLA